MPQLVFAIDFDGTIVQHKFPKIGKLVPGAKECINILSQEMGYDVFLYTMRCGKTLDEAIDFIKSNNIWIRRFNSSPRQFSDSPKQYAHIYIDDSACGCPIRYFEDCEVVNWVKIAYNLLQQQIITDEQFERIKKCALQSDK